MPYERYYSSTTPGLLILLTDELEESVKMVNHVIEQMIWQNFDGDAPRNRGFICVIGYNHNVKELCSGWLKDLDANPLRCENLKRKMPDGTGDIIEVDVKQPVWIEAQLPSAIYKYADAVLLSKELCQKWSEDQDSSPAPIVIDCSYECHADCAKDEIEQLKAIKTADGNVLFFGSFSKNENNPPQIFSSFPKEWKWGIEKNDLCENDFRNGIFKRDKLLSIIHAITDVSGLVAGI